MKKMEGKKLKTKQNKEIKKKKIIRFFKYNNFD